MNRTPHYKLPAMPWGLNIDEAAAQVSSFSPKVGEVKVIGALRAVGLGNLAPAMFHLEFAQTA